MESCSDPLAASLDMDPSRKERMQKAFAELETQRATVSSCTNEWKKLEQHFINVEKAVQKRLQELDDKERAFQVKVQEMEASLKMREDAVHPREEASLSRVQGQKDLAIAAIVEERQKWQEVKNRPESVANVDNSKESVVEIDAKLSSGSLADVYSTPLDPPADVNKEDNSISSTVVVSDEEATAVLKSLCESMDGAGARKFIENNRNYMDTFRRELPAALQRAIDPARLVFDALEGYPLGGQDEDEAPADKKIYGASITRSTCILILESLAVLADPVRVEEQLVISSNIRDKAKEVAETWKYKLDIFGDDAYLLNTYAFLQLLATFNIADYYDDDSLCKLVKVIVRRKRAPMLCKALGLAPKMPDVVKNLAKEGKTLDALSFAHSFGILDKVQPVLMLKAFLKEARRSVHAMVKNKKGSLAVKIDADAKELLALKAVLRNIEEYKLESQYPSAPLQIRIKEIEKTKSKRRKVRKKAAVAVKKAKAKRPKASARSVGGYTGPTLTERSPYKASDQTQFGGAGPSYTVSALDERPPYKTSDRTQFGGAGLSYTVPAPSSYEANGQAGYSSPYGGANRTPVSLSGSHMFSVDGSSLYGSPLYTSPSAIYSNVQFGGGLPPHPPAYQAALLH